VVRTVCESDIDMMPEEYDACRLRRKRLSQEKFSECRTMG